MSDLRIVLLGKTGDGKSSCGNTILGENVFSTVMSPNSATHRCASSTRFISGREITVVDAPGYLDTSVPQKKVNVEIIRCITKCAPGPHAFVLVLRAGRYTEQEKEIVGKITALFGEEALKHTVVLFTHGDQLDENQTIEKFVGQNAGLQEFVNKCGGRVHVIDNRYWNQQQEGYRSNRVQVENLLNTIEQILRENGGQYYTNEMLQVVNRAVEEECERQRCMGNTESLERARQSVFSRLCVRLAGMATGVLLGAFLGVQSEVAIVLDNIREYLFSGVSGANQLPGAMDGAVEKGVAVARGVAGVVAQGVRVQGVPGKAVAGGLVGGAAGYRAAEGAETVTEAMRRAADETYETITKCGIK